MKSAMKAASAFLGFIGSIPVFIYALALLFLRQEILPTSMVVTSFNPDSFILIVSGILGLFGSLIAIAGSALSFYSWFAESRRIFRGGSNGELSGIMLLGAAVSGAVMFAGILALFPFVYIARLNRYATLALGIAAFILLTISGVISLAARQKSEEESER